MLKCACELQAAHFRDDKLQAHAAVHEAGPLLDKCQVAAEHARGIAAQLANVRKWWRQPELWMPLAAAAAAVAADLLGWAPAEELAGALGFAASIHIPLTLVALGAAWDFTAVPRRHVAPAATVLAARVLSGLGAAFVVLVSTPTSLLYAMRGAAIAVCLVAPVPAFTVRARLATLAYIRARPSLSDPNPAVCCA